MSDPIADLLTRLRNAAAIKRTSVAVSHSKLKKAVAEVLKETGYLSEVKTKDGELLLELAVEADRLKLEDVKRISKPGRRIYAPANRLPRVREGLGTAVISTSQGVLSADTARKRKLGGEVLLEVY